MAAQERTNAEWLAELRPPEPSDSALTDLRSYLRGALARVLRGRAGVEESDLDDFCQDALIRILQGLDRFRGDSRFTTWATAVAVRVALSSLRRRHHRDTSLEEVDLERIEPVGGSAPDPDQASSNKALLEALQRAIRDDLTERQRAAVLGELAGLPSSELAARLGTNPNALYKMHHDARKKLRKALNAAGYSDEDVRRELLEASETT